MTTRKEATFDIESLLLGSNWKKRQEIIIKLIYIPIKRTQSIGDRILNAAITRFHA